jgi:hypothetical protein
LHTVADRLRRLNGDGTLKTLTDPQTSGSERYYRVAEK